MTRMSELFPKKISVAVYLSSVMPGLGQDLNKLRVGYYVYFICMPPLWADQKI